MDRRSTDHRIVVMASGNGSNLQAILDAVAAGSLAAVVAAVVSDRPDAVALERARHAGVAAIALPREPGEERPAYDARLASVVARHEPDLIVLAGWMRILTNAFVGRFPDRIVNLHPALPGELAGTNAIERAWEEARAGIRDTTGVMVHRVPDEGVDDGPVLAVEAVPIDPSLPLDELAERIRTVEHRLLVDTIRSLLTRHPTTPDPPRPIWSTA